MYIILRTSQTALLAPPHLAKACNLLLFLLWKAILEGNPAWPRPRGIQAGIQVSS